MTQAMESMELSSFICSQSVKFMETVLDGLDSERTSPYNVFVTQTPRSESSIYIARRQCEDDEEVPKYLT
jgi:hypothetical protein